ncbi:MAG: hypothetical protein M3Y08_11595 [Fibrobacterota bacterium]|nr:hypothetical protein [Fibrobacterota bacterium]
MSLSLSTFKKQPLLPVISILTAVLLFSGQTLNCCCLNESVSDTLTQTFRSMGLIRDLKPQAASEVEPNSHPNSHPNCHGYGSEGEPASTVVPTQPVDPGQNQFASEAACLSELTFTVNAQPYSPLTLSDFPTQVHIGFIDEFAQRLAQFERPRPQNKSSPPIYLLTLRILV